MGVGVGQSLSKQILCKHPKAAKVDSSVGELASSPKKLQYLFG